MTTQEFDSIVAGARDAFAKARTPADLENAKAQFIGKAGIDIDRKVLADIAVHDKAAFAGIVEQVKAKLAA